MQRNDGLLSRGEWQGKEHKQMNILKELHELVIMIRKVQAMTCECGGHFIHPKHLGFDSDGSVLICDNDNRFRSGQPCTNWVLRSNVREKWAKIEAGGTVN